MDALQTSLAVLRGELQDLLFANELYLDHEPRTPEADAEYWRRIERAAKVRDELKELQAPPAEPEESRRAWPT
jgi:hypothetical protein